MSLQFNVRIYNEKFLYECVKVARTTAKFILPTLLLFNITILQNYNENMQAIQYNICTVYSKLQERLCKKINGDNKNNEER